MTIEELKSALAELDTTLKLPWDTLDWTHVDSQISKIATALDRDNLEVTPDVFGSISAEVRKTALLGYLFLIKEISQERA